MKTKNYYLVLAVVTGVLCVPALGEVELPLHTVDPLLIGQAHPGLVGIEELYVVIVPPDSKPNEDGLVWKELQAKVENKLRETAIKIPPDVYAGVRVFRFGIPTLRIDVNMLKLNDSQQYVFHIQTSLSRTVHLARETKLGITADVWKVGPVMQATTVQDMPAAVTNAVLNQVETFISCYQIATQRPVQPADANDITAVTVPKRVGSAAKPAVAKYEYVASKNSKVFHNPECGSAKRILPKNLVGYNGRDEALKAGKRPCKICKP